MSTDVMEPIGINVTDEQMRVHRRIKTAQWEQIRYDAHALIAQDDKEALIVLTARFLGMGPDDGLWVVDANDKCIKGLENAKAVSLRDLGAEMGLPQWMWQ